MALRSVFMLAGAIALPAVAQNPKKIGEIHVVTGHWCRQAQVLGQGYDVYLKDEIKYCGVPLKKTDRIVIRFDRTPPTPPYDRPYECATPGICDANAALWLEGANSIISPPSGAPLWSTPPRVGSVILPDRIVEQGNSAAWTSIGPGTSKGPLQICRVRDGQPDQCKDSADPKYTQKLSPGLYGLYYKDDRKSAAGYVGVVRSDSAIVGKWGSVPYAYKQDNSAPTVMERRAYIRKLFENDSTVSEKHFADRSR